MAIEPLNDREVADGTVNVSYEVLRLGAPSFVSKFAESVPDRVIAAVTAATNSTYAPGTGETPVAPTTFDRLTLAGTTQDGSLVGARVSVGETVLGHVKAHDLSTNSIVLDVVLDTDPTGETITAQRVNALGIDVVRPARGGAVYTTTYSTANAEQNMWLQRMLGTVAIKQVLAVLTKLGVTTVTPGDVMQAVMELGAEGTSLDTFISDEVGALEQSRRASQVHALVSGIA